MPKLFGTFGIRGVANQKLTPELAYDLGLAFATHLDNKGKVAVGYDNRTSSVMIEHALTAGLLAGGCDVLHFGLTPTPVLSFGIRNFSCDGGVIITASHNPPEYNGIKFWAADGSGLERRYEREIERIVEEGGKPVGWKDIGKTLTADAIGPYMKAVLQEVPKFKRKLKVVVDCANAVGALVTPYLLRELGCEVVSMNSQLDGTFPGRKLEPVPENLVELAKTVLACEADAGVAHDGDADRTLLVDEKGEILSGDRVFAIAAMRYLREKTKPRLITTVATSSVIDDVAAKFGGEVVRTRVGEPDIIGEFKNRGGDVGGEENGGVLFFGWVPCRDGIMTAIQFLAALDESGGTVSELNSSLPVYYQVKERSGCPDELKLKVLELLSENFSEYELDRTDGLRVMFDEGWLLLRPSGTEPLFRCFAEAKTKEGAKKLAEMGIAALEEAIKKASASR
jgi:phosphomannomutase/phosphoglucomutase